MKNQEKITHLPNSELEIMVVLWEMNCPATRPEIEARLRDRQSWTPTTVLKFLSRLVEKGFLACEPAARGKKNLYTPLVSENEYLDYESKSVLGRLCGRSVKSLVAHLYENQKIDEKDLDALQAFLEEKRRK